MSATRVLYINHVSTISGAEESLLALLARVHRDVVEPVLACPPGELAARARQLDIRTEPIQFARFKRTANPITKGAYAMAWLAGSNAIRKLVATVKPGIVHSNSSTAHLYAGRVARKAGLPCIWHARDLRRLPLEARTICQKTDRVIAISDAVADFLAASGLGRPVVTRIYNGIDPDTWRERVDASDNVRAELGLDPDDRVLLMAAQFVPWKRHEDAVRAMPKVIEKEPRARLVLAGNDRFGDHPELGDQLRALAEDLNVADRVIFAGYRQDMPTLLNEAELLVVPSDAEPFGRVAIEAMALGKPVVGTRAGGLPEVVRDGQTGLLVVPRFPDSLAAACARILENDSLAHSLGDAGRERVEELFHIQQTVEATQELYETVLHPPLKWTPA